MWLERLLHPSSSRRPTRTNFLLADISGTVWEGRDRSALGATVRAENDLIRAAARRPMRRPTS